MKTFNFSKGREGEEMARKYLENIGYRLVEGNHKNYLGEIDLIMTKSEIVKFIEVKLKIGDRYGEPEEMITKNKLARVKRVAEAFLVLNPKYAKYQKYNIEAVCVILNPDHTVNRITHYENLA